MLQSLDHRKDILNLFVRLNSSDLPSRGIYSKKNYFLGIIDSKEQFAYNQIY